ncbi:hypothetical protein D9M73_233610 [compost metagenome]
MRDRFDGQVADLDLVGRIGGLPLGDEIAGQLAGYGTLLTGTAFDNQDAGHGFDLHRSFAAMEARLEMYGSIKKRIFSLQPIG